ncbi:MAG: bifunctional 5,10-methylenetetrahydrofolate dehydrogenase/5,10-methenyltetrahydrofolate cyclohydrolase [Candidatus Kapabacteria bacterium]|nr:bifunctional 5,10-methylenetetrahydrofolate dehydrogenase/5,10-methenyltetrahydrofolate cyclohydrolase [Ignavibacteriota bacterium]MCW5885339.1 bifunctional 5,10-methylenetetrahydrofolate dehydrogenase/5,10-methenyltetrahydrofolate cyclohydrolase [Candidatus Kapabacteria bacterium]
MSNIIDGSAVAAQIRSELKVKSEILFSEKGIKPGLALLLVGNNPASEIYVNMKFKACGEIGFHSIIERLPDSASEEEVLGIIFNWNHNPEIHGILVQLPLPKQINEFKVLNSISPDKDVDGFHPVNAGKLMLGLPGFVPCTPAGIMELFKRYEINLKGKHAVVIGRSNIVGKPIANLMLQKSPNANAVVTLCHSAAPDLSVFTKQADILVAAIGVAEFIKGDMVKEGVVVIDVGINRVDDPSKPKGYKVVGDVEFETVAPKSHLITPVPKGVGPMTIAMLMSNTYDSAIGRYAS